MRKVCASFALLSLLAVSSFALAAGPAATKAGANSRPRPFWGNVVGTVHWEDHGYQACPTQGGYLTIVEAEGQMNHLGQTTFSHVHCAGDDGLPLDGSSVFTAANGDELWATYVPGSGYWGLPPDAEWLLEEVDYTIVGGTGRFANATGAYHMTVFAMPDHPFEFSIVGFIKY